MQLFTCFENKLGHVRSSLIGNMRLSSAHDIRMICQNVCELILKTCELLHRPILSETFIVDQINHPYVTDEVLRSEEFYRCVILIREPQATLKSLINLLRCHEREALELYINRLESLTQYGLILGERALLVDYDDLVTHTDETLAALTQFLGLDSPLTPTYATHRMTGRVEGFGDPSNNIRVGKIRRTPGHAVTISEDTRSAALRAYCKCRGHLQTAVARPVDRATFPTKAF